MKRKKPTNFRLAERLKRETRGEVLFDDFSRGLYSTDASIYQIIPAGVLVPKSSEDVAPAFEIAGEEGISITVRGGGTSQCGQTVGEGLIIDLSKYLNRVLKVDAEKREALVEPGLVLDQLNEELKNQGLFFPVDVSTSSRATLGGMTGNNSCGARSIRYGKMVDNVLGVEALLASGERIQFGEIQTDSLSRDNRSTKENLFHQLFQIGIREADEVRLRFPDVQRRVGGYNLDELIPPENGVLNPARLLVGSEGTLAFSTSIHLKLQPIPTHKVLGVCHFPSFYEAMDSTQHLVTLNPDAVELVDRTMIELARSIPQFAEKLKRFIKGEPDSLLLVEFTGEELKPLEKKLSELKKMMESMGFRDAVVEALDPAFQKEVWEVRKSGLNIMMSMKGDAKPVSCIEDCAVELKDLAEYTARLNNLFEKYGTTGTWYAHASVGCLHVRPVLNMKKEQGASVMRRITEEAFEIVKEYGGSHSGEHGDGLVRSEFLESMYGSRMVNAFAEVKKLFDPDNLLNPGKIVRPEKMDNRSLFRYSSDYQHPDVDTYLDWSPWGGFQQAAEMCNNNGACRKSSGDVMCPSYRVTQDEKHLTRGRANALRLALSGQLGTKALTSKDMYETMRLCVGCKACARECPTGVDMTRIKSEFLHHYQQEHGVKTRDRMFAFLPRHAPILSKLSPLLHLRDNIPGFAELSENLLGLCSQRKLPKWSSQPFREDEVSSKSQDKTVVLFTDTFGTWFEPQGLRDAVAVLQGSGYQVKALGASSTSNRLCCGRTFLSSGLLKEARQEALKVIGQLHSFVESGIPILGLEPSCIFTIRDDYPSLVPGPDSEALASHVQLIDEFLFQEHEKGALKLPLQKLLQNKIWVHGHCHQKAANATGSTLGILKAIPDLEVELIPSSCCGMAGSFGYESENYETSMKMAELSLLPKIRKLKGKDTVVACGTSCRQQIQHGSERRAVHSIQMLRKAMKNSSHSSLD